MAKVKHVAVGEELDSVEWASENTHELVEGGVLIASEPPNGYHKIYGLYAKKVGAKYHFMMVVNTEPE